MFVKERVMISSNDINFCDSRKLKPLAICNLIVSLQKSCHRSKDVS